MAVNKQTFWNIVIILVTLCLLMFVISPAASQIITKSGEQIEEGGEFTDMSFFAGGTLRLKLKSADDVFVAGGEVTANGVKADHLVLAGGDVTIENIEVNDLMMAGGKVSLKSGTISDDLVAAGGDLNVHSDFKIGGSAVLTGGNLVIDAPVNGELRVAAGRVRLNADVTGDVQLIGEDIVIGPGVNIGGDLRYGTEKLDIDPTATITGATIELQEGDYENFETWGKRSAAFVAIFVIAFLLGIALLVFAICMALPGLMNSSMRMIREKPLPTIAIGFLIMVGFPVAFGLLFRSVIGAPLALIVAIIYLAIVPIAIAASAYFIGMEGRKRLGKKTDLTPSVWERLLWPGGAILIMIIIGFIPLVGKLFWTLVFVFGMGAVATRGSKALAAVE